MIKVFIAGATGWAGSALSKGVFSNKEMQLVGALSRSHAGENLADILDLGEGIFLFLTIWKLLCQKQILMCW